MATPALGDIYCPPRTRVMAEQSQKVLLKTCFIGATPGRKGNDNLKHPILIHASQQKNIIFYR